MGDSALYAFEIIFSLGGCTIISKANPTKNCFNKIDRNKSIFASWQVQYTSALLTLSSF